jgi:MFS family permease
LAVNAFYGWKLLGVFWTIMFINLAFPAYGSSVLNAAMAADLGLDRRTLGLLFSGYMIMSGLPGPLVATSVNRLGVRVTLVIGSLVLVVGALLMAFAVHSGVAAILIFGLLIGSGVATGGALASQSGLARWFVRRRALAIAILYSGSGIGGFVAAPLQNQVTAMANGNWRAGWLLIAALSGIAGILAFLLVREHPADLHQTPDGDDISTAGTSPRAQRRPAHITAENWVYREALATPAYWLMIVSQLACSCGYTLYLAHGIVHLKDLGHTQAAAAWSIGILAVSGLIAKVIFAALGDRLDPRYLWAVFIAVFGVGLVLVVDARNTSNILIFATCLGVGFGGSLVCLMTVLSNYYGTHAFPSLSGLALAINTTLSALAPYVAGWLYDSGRGYGGSFYVLAVWCFVSALVLFVMRPPVRRALHVAAPGVG